MNVLLFNILEVIQSLMRSEEFNQAEWCKTLPVGVLICSAVNGPVCFFCWFSEQVYLKTLRSHLSLDQICDCNKNQPRWEFSNSLKFIKME